MSTELEKHVGNNLLTFLGKYKSQIEQVLPRHMTPARVMKLIIGQINREPKILECTPASVVNAVLTAASMGLEIRQGQAYLIPFNNTKTRKMDCTLIVDYRGKIDLAIRSGKVNDIDAEVVYSNDKFRMYRDEAGRKRLEHEPAYYKRNDDGTMAPISESDRGTPIGAYAIAELRVGASKIVFMPAIDIQKVKERSKAKDYGPWVTDEAEMWKKTVVHRICKTLPQSPELAISQDIDERADSGISLDTIIDVAPEDETAGPILPQSREAAAEVARRKIIEMGGDPGPVDEQGDMLSPIVDDEPPRPRKGFGGR